jgi:predicted permease
MKEWRMGTFSQDFRYGVRMLVKNPGFALIAILTLALGIGANTGLFSVVNGLILSPLPFANPQQLVAVYSKTQFDKGSITFPNFLDWQKENHTFSAMAAYRSSDFSLTGSGEPERLHGQQISAEFFPSLGIAPILGRTFRAEEDQVGAAPVALISDALWKTKFGSSQDVLGKNLTLNDTQYIIVGVVPGRLPMFGTQGMDVYVPIGQWNDPTFRDRKIGMGTQGIARMKPGVNLEQAQADMNSVARNLSATYPEADKDTGVVLVPLKKDIVGDIEGTLFVLLGAVGFVLLIACTNVANLLLARSAGRSREFAIRAALGANQMRVIRQLLTESVLLSVCGGLFGLAFAKWGTQAVLTKLPEALPRADAIHLDARVLLFTLAVSIVAGIVFGLAPAIKTARPNLGETLREGGRGSSGTRHATQRVFVVVEMALSLVLLVGAGLMIRSLAALGSVKPGFNPRNVVTFSLGLSPARLTSPAVIRQSLRAVEASFKSVPGVEGASVTAGSLPMTGDSEVPFWLDGQPKPATDSEMNLALWYPVDPDYLKVMGIPLIRGRFISERDTEKSPMVVVIDQNFARQFFPNEDPIGKRINMGLIGGRPEIVGIVGHVNHWGLGDTAHQNLQSEYYMPLMQLPDQIFPLVAGGVGMVVRTSGNPDAFMPAIRKASTDFDSKQVIYDFRPMEIIVSDSIATQRFTMTVLGVFSGLALVLSAIGIYGVISYLAGQRTHEIGVRVALGAQPKDIFSMVLSEGMKVALLGVAIGIVASLALTRLMTKMIFGVRAADPITFAGVTILLTLVAAAACYIPARRAMRVDPLVALRYE